MLVLGPVVFRGFEVPARVRFGGRQVLAVHALAGGGRVVDAMGAAEGPLSWEGVFSGVDAGARVRLLERLRRDGGVLPLSWGGWRYSVLIERFEALAQNPAWVPYRLRCTVVSVAESAGDDAAPLGWSAAEAADLGAGEGLEGRIAAASVALGSDDLGVAIEAAGALARLVAARGAG